jgi:MinD superfamily P-loop ATPase
MRVAVASGKGGTGKTTVAVNLALSLGDVQMIDCDVEEPNAHIFLKAEMHERESVSVTVPNIDKDACDYCGTCADFCAYNALAVVPTDVLVFPELCHSCGGCELVCPQNAIGWHKREVGFIEHGTADGIELYHGLLHVGEIQAIPIIKKLKGKIDATRQVILDAPPGTSCPVIETLGGADCCLLVTEPTPFGLHDLKLAVDVVRHLNTPFGVVINRNGVGDTRVETYCRRESIPVLMKIPHSEEIAYLYSQGIPFVQEIPTWRTKFQRLFDDLRSEAGA